MKKIDLGQIAIILVNLLKKTRHSGLLATLLALNACGGGGGGGGGGASPGGGPGGGNPAPLVFSAQNAPAAAEIVLTTLEATWFASELTSLAVDVVALPGSPNGVCIAGNGNVVPIFVTTDDADGDGLVSAGDAISADFDDCDGFTVDVTVTIDAVEIQLSSFEARVSLSIQHVDGLTANGSFQIDSTYRELPPLVEQTLSDIVLTVTAAGMTEQFNDATFEKRYNDLFSYEYAFAGDVDSERLDGEFSFSTPAPFAGAGGRLPDAGQLNLEANGSLAQLSVAAEAPNAPEFLELAVDATGSGTFGPIELVPWRSLVAGIMFGWIPHDPPEITSLTLSPDSPTGIDDLTAQFAATDPEGSDVSFRYSWFVNGVLVAGQSTNGQFAYLDADRFGRDDLVEFELIASDGDLSSLQRVSTVILNIPPVDPVVTIEPPNPRTTQLLTAVWSAFDADLEPLTPTFEWYVNDVLVPAFTGSFLQAPEFLKNDVVRVVVEVSDGAAAVVAEATTTIVDTPPEIFLSQPPSEVAYDQLLSLSMSATDDDGDAVDNLGFRIHYGPSGMTIDPMSGEIIWLDKGPMFEDRMTVRFGIGVADPGSNIATGTIDVVDPDRELALFRSPIPYAQPNLKGLVGGDFDGDGDQELLVASTDFLLYELESEGSSYRLSWTHPGLNAERDYVRSIATADLDGDAKAELFLAHTLDRVSVLDGATRRLRASADYPCRQVAVADLTGDGALEVVCFDLTKIHVLEAETLNLLWQFPAGAQGWDFVVGDVDLDPQLEIVTSFGFVYDGQSYALERDLGAPGGQIVAIGDTNDDGENEIVISDWGTGLVRGFSGVSGAELFSIPIQRAGALRIVDVGGGSEAEIIVGDWQSDPTLLRMYRDQGGATPDLIASLDEGWLYGISAIEVFDIDNDGETEVVFGSGDGPHYLAIASTDLAAVEWRSLDSGAPIYNAIPIGGALAGDPLNAPSPLYAVLVFGLADETRLTSMDPASGELDFGLDLGPPELGVSAVMTVTDFDNDGTDEAFVALKSGFDVRFYAADFFNGAIEWTSPSALSVPNPDVIAHGDLTGDGHDDLIAIAANTLYVYDVWLDSLVYSVAIFGSEPALEVANVNGSGSDEIIVSDGPTVAIYSNDDGSGIARAATFDAGRTVMDVVADDIDGDGTVDIFVLVAPSQTYRNGVIYRLDSALANPSAAEMPIEADFIAVERSAHARRNLIAWEDRSRGPFVVFDGTQGEEVWRLPHFLGELGDGDNVRYVDLDGTGDYRILVTTSDGMYVTQ